MRLARHSINRALTAALALGVLFAPGPAAARGHHHGRTHRRHASGGSAVAYRLAVGGGRTSLMIPLANPRLLHTRKVAGGLRWELSTTSSVWGHSHRGLDHGPLKAVDLDGEGHHVAVTATWRFAMSPRPALTAGAFHLDVGDQPPAQVARRTVNQGLSYQRISRWTPAGPMVINVLKVDLGRMTLEPRLARMSEDMFAVDTVRRIATRARALAAINGTYFSYRDGHPIGLLMVDGQIVSSSYFNRSVFGIRYDGTCFVDNARLLAAVQLEDGKIFLANAVNMHAGHDRVVLYTYHYGPSTRNPQDPTRQEWPIERDGTVEAPTHGDATIPDEGYVLSAEGEAVPKLARNLHAGMRVQIFSQLNGVWKGVRCAIGGGPTLVHGGEVQVTARREHIAANIAHGRAPRTAVGYLGGRQAVLVTVDGRQQHSVGASLYELARIMRGLGAREAINLDGGGSSTMVVHSRVVNGVSGGERRVNNALVVLRSS